jgi:uncharacterized protein DUF4296
MMHRRTIAIGVLAILAACASDPPPPEGLLPREVFKELLLQANLLEAEAAFSQVHDRADSTALIQRYDSLFARNQVSRADFETTYGYYEQHMEELKAINEEVLTELTRRKEQGR